MKENFEAALAAVLKHEGGWSDHPKDPGGATMKGVTLATYEQYLGRKVSKVELQLIPDFHLRDLYRTRYWNSVRGDDLPSGVDFAVFDMAVNSGSRRAARVLQTVLGVTSDGLIGPQTLSAAKSHNPIALIESYQRARQDFLETLPTFATFGKGWTRRVDDVKKEALEMAGREF